MPKTSGEIICHLYGGPQDGRELSWPAPPPLVLEFPWQVDFGLYASGEDGVPGDADMHPLRPPIPVRYRLVGTDTITAKLADGSTDTAILCARYVHVP